jgi:hypothetical protein
MGLDLHRWDLVVLLAHWVVEEVVPFLPTVIMKAQVALRTTIDMVDRHRPTEDAEVEGVEVEIGTLGHLQAEIDTVGRLQAEIDTVGRLQDVTGIADKIGHLQSTIGTIANVTAVAVLSIGKAAGVIEIFMWNGFK